jgi:phosphoribosylformylglycinamidine (FGAM) synthase-like enzyme
VETGVALDLPSDLPFETMCFSETPSRYLLEVDPQNIDKLLSILGEVQAKIIGTFTDDATVSAKGCSWNIDDLHNTWLGGLQI